MVTLFAGVARSWTALPCKDHGNLAEWLFGVICAIAEGDLNSYLVHHFEAFPFAAVGLVIGLVGLILAFQREK